MVNCCVGIGRSIFADLFEKPPLKPTTNTPDYQVHEFPNGIRLIHRQVYSTKIVHCGFVLDVGSRDELPQEQGIAHFWEHMAFKGTEKRKSFHIINRLEILGGEINAYTTKEKIAFHASLLADHYSKAVDLLTDITFFSTFPKKEIEKERRVILEEMAMYLDSPDDAIQDEFDLLLFPDHAIGKNILGTEESLASFQQADFVRFYQKNVSTQRLVFSVVGPFDFKTAVRKAAPFLEKAPTLHPSRVRTRPNGFCPTQITVPKPITQAHLMLGWRAYSIENERKLPLFLVNNLLGGPALNSRLNMSIREKHGLVYAVESGYTPFVDTGALTVYLGTEPRNLEKAESLVWKEINRMKITALSSNQLHLAKEQIKGQLAMAEEGNMNMMLMLAKATLDQGRVESLGEIFDAIDKLTPGILMEVANEVLDATQWARLAFVPLEKKKKH